jgi:hypothetical protein
MTQRSLELTAKQRRRGLEFADRLAELAAEAPDYETKQAAYKATNEIRKKYGFSTELKKKMILFYIEQGASKIDDLIRETSFDRDDVYSITRELETAKLVRFDKIQLTGSRGRPTILIFPIKA